MCAPPPDAVEDRSSTNSDNEADKKDAVFWQSTFCFCFHGSFDNNSGYFRWSREIQVNEVLLYMSHAKYLSILNHRWFVIEHSSLFDWTRDLCTCSQSSFKHTRFKHTKSKA